MSVVICPPLSKISSDTFNRTIEIQTYRIFCVVESALYAGLPKPPQVCDVTAISPAQRMTFRNVLLDDMLGKYALPILLQEVLPVDPLKPGGGGVTNGGPHLQLRAPMYYSALVRMFLMHLPAHAKHELAYNENREISWLTTTDAQHTLPQLINQMHATVGVIIGATILRIMLDNIQRNPAYLLQTPIDRIIEDNKAALPDCIAYAYGIVIPFVAFATYATQVQLSFNWANLIAAGHNLIGAAQADSMAQFGPRFVTAYARALELYNTWWATIPREACGARLIEILGILETRCLGEQIYNPLIGLLSDQNVINALFMHGIHVVIPEWTAFQGLPSLGANTHTFQSVRERWLKEVLLQNHNTAHKGHTPGVKGNLNKQKLEGSRSGLIGSRTAALSQISAVPVANASPDKMYPGASYNMMAGGYGSPYMPAPPPPPMPPSTYGGYGAMPMPGGYGCYPGQGHPNPMMPPAGPALNNPYAPAPLYGPPSGSYPPTPYGVPQPQPYANPMGAMGAPPNTTPALPMPGAMPNYYPQPNMLPGGAAFSAPPAYNMMPGAYNAPGGRV